MSEHDHCPTCGTPWDVAGRELREVLEELRTERDAARSDLHMTAADYYEDLQDCLRTVTAERDAAIEIAIGVGWLYIFPTVDEARAEVRRLIAERIKGALS